MILPDGVCILGWGKAISPPRWVRLCPASKDPAEMGCQSEWREATGCPDKATRLPCGGRETCLPDAAQLQRVGSAVSSLGGGSQGQVTRHPSHRQES